MADKEIVLVTGANTGIGYEVVKALVQSPRPYHILLGSRTPSKGDAAAAELTRLFPGAKSAVQVVQIDVTDDESIARLRDLVETAFGRLDVLINNAGAIFDGPFATDTSDISNLRSIFNKTYDVNVTATQVLTAALAPLLIKGSSPRLVFLASGLSTLAGNAEKFYPPWGPNPPGGWPKDALVLTNQSYRVSKAALNLAMLNWHWFLKEDGVRTWSVSPGFLATGLGNRKDLLIEAGAGDPALGGDLIKRVIEGERDADVGKVVSQNGRVQPW